MNQVFLRWHLGLGDAIVCNALVRHLAVHWGQVFVPARRANVVSEQFMWRELPNVHVVPVSGDEEVASKATKFDGQVMRLGFWARDGFDKTKWNHEFYRQVGLNPQQGYAGFDLARSPEREVQPGPKPYVFVHEDPLRDFRIDQGKLPNLPIERPDGRTCIFDYLPLLEQAEEIHCIDSCFALLADYLPSLEASRLVWHRYARNGTPPIYRKDWAVL